ncbi:MAG: histidinol-phosphatase [Ruminococcus sp.]|nr:histidinol-phosphatase [Ruminococcus sp.]
MSFKDCLEKAINKEIKADFHMHTCLCDGHDTAEDMVLSAIEKGFAAVGISGHSYTFFDESYCMSRENVLRYISDINSLKEKYKNQIQVFCGIEQDFYSEYPTDEFDYVIGSVHYLKCEEEYVPVDETPDILISACEKYFGGDICALCECYFDTVSKVVEKTGCDIIGHFDLITKFIEKEPLFDTKNPRYQKAWKKAVDILLPYDIPFEINNGAISRGYRMSPYPAADIIAYIRENGGRLILSSDAHSKEDIGFGFEDIGSL